MFFKLGTIVLMALISTSCLYNQAGLNQSTSKVDIDMSIIKDTFEPIPDTLIDIAENKDLILLGRELYLDPRLSINNKISCNSCHGIKSFGVDNEATSPGHDGRRGDRNSPSSFNAALHLAQFWDGRAKDVEEQALGPILNPIEMGMPSEEAVIQKLGAIDSYVQGFKRAFRQGDQSLSYKNIGVAIGAYERTLMTPSRFDSFLKGKTSALSVQEKRGLKKFVEIGCISCHNGVGIGGNSYQQLGLVEEYHTEDLGRYNVTKDESDKKVFKVPSLRNVMMTGPYFHDGSIKTVDEAITKMAWHQLGEKVDASFVEDVKAFLGSLTSDKKFY